MQPRIPALEHGKIATYDEGRWKILRARQNMSATKGSNTHVVRHISPFPFALYGFCNYVDSLSYIPSAAFTEFQK